MHAGFDLDATRKTLKDAGLDESAGVKALGLLKQEGDQGTAAWRAEVSRWDAETRRLPAEELETALSVMREFATPALRELFEQTGAGSHPAMAKLLARLGRDLGEARAQVRELTRALNGYRG